MSTKTIHSVFEKQQRFFNTHVTLEYVYRKDSLKRLEHAINTYENSDIDIIWFPEKETMLYKKGEKC